MTPHAAVIRGRHCPRCRVDIGALNCPRCGRLTEVGPHVRAARKIKNEHHVYVSPDYLISQEVYGRQDRKKVEIPKEES